MPAGVEAVGRERDLVHRHVRRRERVQRLPELARLDDVLAAKGHDLPHGVHAGIGPTRGRDANRMPQRRRERRFEHALQRARVRLELPAVVLGAVVLEEQAVLHHDGSCASVAGWRRSRL